MPARKILSIYVDKEDRWRGGSLAEALVRTLHRHQVAGATVVEGFMGFGGRGRVHHRGLFGISDSKPVIITAIDEEHVLREALQYVKPMVAQGLITLQDIEVVPLTAPEPPKI
jgi:PII-like signaling protein